MGLLNKARFAVTVMRYHLHREGVDDSGNSVISHAYCATCRATPHYPIAPFARTQKLAARRRIERIKI